MVFQEYLDCTFLVLHVSSFFDHYARSSVLWLPVDSRLGFEAVLAGLAVRLVLALVVAPVFDCVHDKSNPIFSQHAIEHTLCAYCHTHRCFDR